MSRISELGAMPRVGWSGASMTSTKSPLCPMPLTSPGSSRAPSSQNAKMGWPSILAKQQWLCSRGILNTSKTVAIRSFLKRAILISAQWLWVQSAIRTRFWSKLIKLPSVSPPKTIRRLLKRSLPYGAQDIAFSHRIAGVGSLGRPRYLVTAFWGGGLAAREAKAWLPSAWGWAANRPKDHDYSIRLVKRAVRQKDPYYTVEDGWVLRRVGPHCERIELAQFPKRRDERLILRDMGRETANLHLATLDQRTKILRDLNKRKADWLVNAAHALSKATEQDWEAFRSSQLAPQS